MATGIIEYGRKEQVVRRKHYRIDCFWNLECMEILEDSERAESTKLQGNTKEGEWIPVMTTDISGGGCRFNSTKQFMEDCNLIIKIRNPEKDRKEDLLFDAKVIASQVIANRKELYETRIRFVDLSFSKQEQLIRWIFEEKRKSKWKERGLKNEEKYFDY